MKTKRRYIKEFEMCLPIAQAPVPEGTQMSARRRVKADAFTIDQILSWSDEARGELERELKNVISSAFPNMSEQECHYIAACYFRKPGRKLHRQAVLFRNETGNLIATALFDQGEVVYEGRDLKGIYNILRAALPEYQGSGLGQTIASKVLMELQPDVLLVTTYQSSSLHSWVGLSQKRVIPDFEVYPRLEQKNGKDVLVTLPYKELDFAISVFKQTFIGFIQSEEELDKKVRNLTVHLIRKNAHEDVYDFHPWRKDGKDDKLAEALGVTDRDAIVVMFRKK